MQAGDFYFRPPLVQHVTTAPWYRRLFTFCLALNGKIISIDDNFMNSGETLTTGEGDDTKTMRRLW